MKNQSIGILDTPRTGPFLYDLIDEIEALAWPGVTADIAKLPIVPMGFSCPYAVIIDRLSHVVPFYRSYLKNALLGGTYVINDPFWFSADDKFLNCAIATGLGVAVPKTVCLPSKTYPPGFVGLDLQNLPFPLNWEEAVAYTGFPAILKPVDGRGWKDVYRVESLKELWAVYDETGRQVMILQEYIAYERYFRCFVLGKQFVLPVDYDPHTRSYCPEQPDLSPDLAERIRGDSLQLVRALGYDMNTIEFAVRDGIPYAIDFMNPVPDFNPEHIGLSHYRWIVRHMAQTALDKLSCAREQLPERLRSLKA